MIIGIEFLIMFIIFGLMVGSYLNALIYRLPREIDTALKRSACPKCDKIIYWYENIPVLSYVFLKGRCSGCKNKISIQYPIVEILTAVAAYLLAPKNLNPNDLMLFAFYFSVFCAFLVHFLVDIKHQILPDQVNIFLGLLFFAMAVVNLNWVHWSIGGLIGVGFPLLVTWVFYLLRGQVGLGGGDMKLFGVLGLYLGPIGIMQNIFLSCFLGALVGGGLMIMKIIKRDHPIAFGPFIIVVSFVQIFFPQFFKSLLSYIPWSKWVSKCIILGNNLNKVNTLSSGIAVTTLRDRLNDLLYFGPKGLIGIDIGSSAIKLAEVSVQSNGKVKLNRYLTVPLPEATFIEDEIHKEDEFVECLTNGLKELNSSYKFACVGISGQNTLIKKLQLPGGSEQEIEDQVLWETEQYLPFPPEEGNVSHTVIGENEGGGVEVIVGAAKRELVYKVKEIVERSKIKVKICDLSAAASMNVFEHVLGRALKDSSWLLLDIGSQKTTFTIYKNGILSFFKEINVGGITITEEIQRQMGVNFEEAESLKIHGDGGGNIPEEIVVIINQVLDTLFSEIRRTVEFWTASTSEDMFNGCVLTGGTSAIPGLKEALEELLNTEVEFLNPFESISVNEKNIDDDILEEISFRGISAIGLGMRSLND